MPLPFDELEAQSLVEKLEAYEPKSDLMIEYLIADLDIDKRNWAWALRRNQLFYVFGEIPTPEKLWNHWKAVIVDVTGKSWPECAELIYGEMF